MEATDTLTRPQQRYGDDEQAAALAVLAECGNNAEEASRRTGIPASTIKEWRAGNYRPPSPELVAEHARRRAARWDEVQDAAVTQALAKLPEASARDAAVVAGIATDKARDLRTATGPAPTAETDARIAELQALFGTLLTQRAAVTVHVHTAPPSPAAPLTLSPSPESQE